MLSKHLQSINDFGLILIDMKGEIIYANDFSIEHFNITKTYKSIRYYFPSSTILSTIETFKTGFVSYEEYSNFVFYECYFDNNRGLIIIFPLSDMQRFLASNSKQLIVEQELEAVMNLSGELVTIINKEGIIQRVSNACEKIMGMKKEEFVGKSVYNLEKEGIVSFSSSVRVLTEKKRVTVQQVTKSDRSLIVNGYPILDKNGEIEKVVNFSKDITEVSDLKEKLKDTKSLLLYYQEELNKQKENNNRMVFKSRSMEKVLEIVKRVSKFDTTVLIQGDTGVGKEVLAQKIHEMSNRRKSPFLRVNCGAIPESLIESEFFGYSKGAFTGAQKEGKKGLIQAADSGTLFLDEIGELPLNLQTKLLEVLQEKEFIPIGETKPVNVDVRFIAATNRELEKMVKAGDFRQDLFYRLYIIPITIPPLTERKEDIPFLINHFLEEFNHKYGQSKTISKDVIDLFVEFEWPGNVRELQNLLERLVITVPDSEITFTDIPSYIKKVNPFPTLKEVGELKSAVDEYEKSLILEAIKDSENLKEASIKLGIHPSTLGRKVKKLNIKL